MLAEKFRFGNVGGGVKVEPVAGRAVRLIARDETFRMRPRRPLGQRFFGHDFGNGLAIIALHAVGVVVVVLAEERGQFGLQSVAAPFFKFGE